MFGLFKKKTPKVFALDKHGKIISVTPKGRRFVVVGQYQDSQIGWQSFKREIDSSIVGFNWGSADFRVDWV